MSGTCVIVGAGSFTESELLLSDQDFLIAADGGYDRVCALGRTPDLVIGDFDSLHRIPNHPSTIVLPTEKDDTDMAAAVEEGVRRGFRQFAIYGGMGGRFEHSVANLQLLAGMKTRGLHAVLYGSKEKIFFLRGPEKMEFAAGEKGFLSVFSHSDVCVGVNERGLKYALYDQTLTNQMVIGISNEFIGQQAMVSVEQGLLCLIQERKEVR